MLAKFRSRLTFANVVSVIALFVALGGSSYAALTITGRNVPRNALTGADIKNLTGADVRNNSLDGRDVRNLTSGDVANGRLLAEDFAPGQLPAGPKGDQGNTGAPGTARGWAHVFGNGTVESSKNIDVAHAGAGGGQYCVRTAFTPKVLVVTPEWEGTGATNNRVAHSGITGFGGCASILPGTNAYVVIQRGDTGAVVDSEFFLMADGT